MKNNQTSAIEAVKQIKTPGIISANTYFWTPNRAASGRRYSEKKQYGIVENFLTECGLTEKNDWFVNDSVEVRFYYKESCSNVYKSFEVYRNGKKSNIRGLAAELKKKGIELV